MNSGDTIIAIASPHARAARGLIRVSGAGTRSALLAMVGEREWVRGVWPMKLSLGEGLYVPVVVACFPGPLSYTGEDSAEIQCPGNPALMDRIVTEMIKSHGLRAAEGGEFTARAYLGDRLTLEEAEGVAAVIAARSAWELAGARAVLAGEAGRRWRVWMEECATLLALVEAGIDFTDQEDVVAISPGELRARLTAMAGAIEAEVGPERASESGRAVPRVVLFGAPNAGKSTLFNRLLGRKRAVESAIAGTTRDALVELLDLSGDAPGGGAVELVDVAGYDGEDGATCGRAGDSVEGAGQRAAVGSVQDADVVVHCDPRGEFVMPSGIVPRGAIIRVRTKGDLSDARPVDPGVISVCAIDGWNLDLLRQGIAGEAWRAAETAAPLVPRHRRALVRTLEAIREAAEGARAGPRLASPEIVAGALRAATDAMGELLGRISPDEVLGRIFASFCIGK
ncbi:MAG: GTPase [Planctomycetota bacterium]